MALSQPSPDPHGTPAQTLKQGFHMHRCLLIQEVLRTICAYFDTSIYPRRLLTMALVCRHFFDTSMDCLWRRVPSIFLVLGCLPSDIWRAPLTFSGIANAALARAIIPADLERFNKIYAHRVRFFTNLIRIPADIYQALGFAFRGQPVFPNLVEFYQGLGGIPYISMFLAPHIRVITLALAANKPAQTSLLTLLGEKCPALIRFSLDTKYNSDIGCQMNHVLPGWTQLQTLIIPYLPEESLQVVAGLPHLLHLELTRVDKKFGDTFSPVSDHPIFPVLQTLFITTNTFILCANLLRAATNCPLKSFTLCLYGAPIFDWHNLFSALAESCSKETLKTILATDSDVADEWETPDTTDQLQPLLLFTNLTSICLTTRYGFDVDDTFLREMAAAWPHLQHLNIGPTKMRQPIEQQRLTLQGLAPLANLCPDLQSLKVHIDATCLRSNHVNSGSGSSSSRVAHIIVGHSPISQSSVPWVAAYLSEVFPRLYKIHWANPTRDDDEEKLAYPKRWLEVTNHLAAYRHVRGHGQDLHCGIKICFSCLSAIVGGISSRLGLGLFVDADF